jgi:hypothetical protein
MAPKAHTGCKVAKALADFWNIEGNAPRIRINIEEIIQNSAPKPKKRGQFQLFGRWAGAGTLVTLVTPLSQS